jgi:hypothetical protein
MKNYVIFFLLFLPYFVFGYSWTLYGPQGIKANDICFNAGSEGYTVICGANGIFISDGFSGTWNNYTNLGLPVWEAIPFDNTNILLVMGDGSASDGIYRFNLTTHEFIPLKQLPSPTFIKYCSINQSFYAGSKQNGLWNTMDGVSWNEVPDFASMPVSTMDYYNNTMVLSTGFYFQSVYNSYDAGLIWNHTTGNGNFLSYIAYHPNGKLYGIIPYSNSTSLRVSNNAGQDWDYCFWSNDGLNTLGFDVVGNIFVGWRNVGIPKGIARYDTSSSSLTFFNDGLPNLFINRIKTNPLLSSITIFCCTDGGVYYSNDYLTGTSDRTSIEDNLNVTSFPNPVLSSLQIEFNLTAVGGNSMTLVIYNSFGAIVSEKLYQVKQISTTRIQVNVSNFPMGCYFFRLKAGKYDVTRKMVVIK